MEQGPAPDDDPSIPADEILYRRVKNRQSHIVRDSITGDERPSSAAFRPDSDGLSVYRDGLLRQASLTATDVRTGPDDVVFAFEVGQVRAVRVGEGTPALGVRDDPWPQEIADETHPRNSAHALVVGFARMDKGQVKRAVAAMTTATWLRRVIG